MTVRIFHGAWRVAEVPADDRGLAYGDGLFETMRAHRGRVHWWDAHWSRLTTGSARLKLPLPAESLVRAEAEALLEGDDGVLKLLVTRGRGGRGYAPPGEATPTWLLSTHALPVSPAEGLALRWCDTRLAVQPLLAGLKHCNRLEQVMARAEWTLTLPGDTAFRADEGLMRSTAGDVVCATSANLFVLPKKSYLVRIPGSVPAGDWYPFPATGWGRGCRIPLP